MKVDIYWIAGVDNGRLAIMPRPRSGAWLEDELKAWHRGGVDVVVSLLTPPEITELGLQSEPAVCRENQLEYLSYPILDRQVPSSSSNTVELVRRIRESLSQNKGVAIHCRMGVGRSALVAACVLVSQGFQAQKAFDLIRQARGIVVPDTDEQRDWVNNLSANLRGTAAPASTKLQMWPFRS